MQKQLVQKSTSHHYKRWLALIGLLLIGSCDTKNRISSDFLTEEDMKGVDPWEISPAVVEKLTAQAGNGDGFSAWMLYIFHAYNHDPQAHRYLVQAAELGVPEAQCSYYSYLVQTPDRKTREDAVIWLKKAAQQGFKPAIVDLEYHEEVLRLAQERHKVKR